VPFIVYLPKLDTANPVTLPLDAGGFTTQEVKASPPPREVASAQPIPRYSPRCRFGHLLPIRPLGREKIMRRFLCVGIAAGIIHWTLQFIAWSYAGAFSPEMSPARRVGTAVWNLLSAPYSPWPRLDSSTIISVWRSLSFFRGIPPGVFHPHSPAP